MTIQITVGSLVDKLHLRYQIIQIMDRVSVLKAEYHDRIKS